MKNIRKFKYTMFFLVCGTGAWVTARIWSHTLCIGGKSYYPGLGYRCDAYAPDKLGTAMLLVIMIAFVGFVVSLVVEALWPRCHK